MRTKTLLIAAAALVAGIFSSDAQVYSANVVGYINLTLTNGITLIAPQLDYDGTGTNNNVNELFSTNLPVGTQVSGWSPSLATFVSASWTVSKGVVKWTGNTNFINQQLNSQGALFINSPSNATITAVGTVLQGTNTIPLTGGMFNLVNNIAPVAGGIQTTLGYVPSVGDKVLLWSNNIQNYVVCSYSTLKGVTKWSPFEPQLSVGSGAFIVTTATPAWTNGFTAQ